MLDLFRMGNISNMDQVPLQFEFLSGSMYDTTGTQTVWGRSQVLGFDKCQATIHLTIHATRVPQTKPLLVFCSKATQITTTEK